MVDLTKPGPTTMGNPMPNNTHTPGQHFGTGTLKKTVDDGSSGVKPFMGKDKIPGFKSNC